MTATKIDSDLAHLFYRREKIKRVPSWKTLLQICSTDKDKPKGIIFNECSTEEDKQECVHKNINKQKDANNESEYEESSVTD